MILLISASWVAKIIGVSSGARLHVQFSQTLPNQTVSRMTGWFIFYQQSTRVSFSLHLAQSWHPHSFQFQSFWREHSGSPCGFCAFVFLLFVVVVCSTGVWTLSHFTSPFSWWVYLR
jgi:hypothetical protein